MRWTPLLLVVACLGTASPCAADFVLQWSAPAIFPGSPNPAGAPLPLVYLRDFNGDGALDLINQIPSDNALLIRDVQTGVVHGQIDLHLDGLPGSVVSGVTTVDYTLPLILVCYTASDYTTGIAAYRWQSTAAVQDAPSQSAPVAKSHPNPFRERTSFDLSLLSPGRVEVEVFDVSGRVVRKLDAGQLTAGLQRVEWDGTDQTSRPLAAGTYFYTVSVNGVAVGSQKAVLLR